MARKYSEDAQEKVGNVVREFKQGKLKSGFAKKAAERNRLVALDITEDREEGLRAPKRTQVDR